MSTRHLTFSSPRGFTLLELLAAAAIMAVVLTALYGVFFGSIRLREGDFERFEKRIPRDRVAAILKQDIACMMPPGGIAILPLPRPYLQLDVPVCS